MTTNELCEALGGKFVTTSNRATSVSSHVARRVTPSETLVVVGGERPAKTQIDCLLDALELRRHGADGKGSIRIALGTLMDGAGTPMPEASTRVLETLSTLTAALQDTVSVTVELDLLPQQLTPPDFAKAGGHWFDALVDRDRRLATLPTTAVQLSSLVDDPSFRWYATVTQKGFQGRVEGLTVCKLNAQGTAGVLSIGGAKSKTRPAFHQATNGADKVRFTAANLDDAAAMIRKLVKQRRPGGPLHDIEPEHHLESRVLRGDLPVRTSHGQTLEVVSPNGQFPTFWSGTDSARYLDVLARDGSTPWVIELKVMSGGAGGYLRHAIGQVVLYREFIRRATPLHSWFRQQTPPLDPTACRAMVAFPTLTAGAKKRLAGLTQLASLFEVDVIELDS